MVLKFGLQVKEEGVQEQIAEENIWIQVGGNWPLGISWFVLINRMFIDWSDQ